MVSFCIFVSCLDMEIGVVGVLVWYLWLLVLIILLLLGYWCGGGGAAVVARHGGEIVGAFVAWLLGTGPRWRGCSVCSQKRNEHRTRADNTTSMDTT